jgi:hypothetical protein
MSGVAIDKRQLLEVPDDVCDAHRCWLSHGWRAIRRSVKPDVRLITNAVELSENEIQFGAFLRRLDGGMGC